MIGAATSSVDVACAVIRLAVPIVVVDATKVV